MPPIANDDVAPAPAAGAGSVTVNVLKNDDDPLGSPGDLKISWAPAGVTVAGPNLTVRLEAEPREVPYQVTAPDGLTATAVVYVPGTQSTAIRVRPGARITLKADGSSTVPLSSVLDDTSGRQLKITTVNQLSASPGGDLTVSANQASAFQVHALGAYTGPGAVTVQVYDGATMQDPHGAVATLTIPAQVGPDVPILRCPQDPIQVVEGGAPVSYDIGQLCHVWVDTTVPAPALRYSHVLDQGGRRGQRQRARRHQPPADRREQRRARQHGDGARSSRRARPPAAPSTSWSSRRRRQPGGPSASRSRPATASRSTSASTSPARSPSRTSRC